MVPFEQVSTTGIYRDDTAQCYEAWLVDLVTGQKRLASTCSTCVPEEQYHWWVQQVWSHWFALGDLPLPAAA
jgi:hypothetical protein